MAPLLLGLQSEGGPGARAASAGGFEERGPGTGVSLAPGTVGRRLLWLLTTAAVCSVALAPPTAAVAAQAATFDTYRVSLWPEYDDPRLLVIEEPLLSASAVLPYRFSGAVPKDAQVNMACQIAASGQHECQPYERVDSGEGSLLGFTAPSRKQLYLEYYTDPLGGERPKDRRLDYVFTAPADIGTLQLEVKQPKDAAGFKLDPAPKGSRTDAEGFTWAQYSVADLKAGQSVAFKLAYSRPTWEPPVRPAAQSAAPGARGAPPPVSGQAAPGGSQSSVAILFAAVVVSGTLWMVMSRRVQATAGPKSPPRKRSGAEGHHNRHGRGAGGGKRRGASTKGGKDGKRKGRR